MQGIMVFSFWIIILISFAFLSLKNDIIRKIAILLIFYLTLIKMIYSGFNFYKIYKKKEENLLYKLYPTVEYLGLAFFFFFLE